jgi:ABC-type multidrug transport system fused ATPase/permease subunit
MSIASSVNSDEPNFEQQRLKGEEYYREISPKEMMTYYDPRYLAWVGFGASFAVAFGMPFFGYILSQYIITIGGVYDFTNDSDRQEFKSECDRWTFFFFIFTICLGILTFIQKVTFGLGGDNLSYTLRLKLFSAILYKHVGWFDSKDHAPGILTTVLIEDIIKVNGLTTEAVGILLEAFLGLGISCLMCFIFCW